MGEGTPVDYARAAAAFETSCDLGQSASCAELGYLYMLGKGVTKDPTRGEQLLKKACDAEDGVGCGGMAIARHEQRDLTAAHRFAEEACRLQDRGGCRFLATLLLKGDGVARDPARAVALLDSACAAEDFTACFGLANTYGVGVGVPRDTRKANALARKACDGGVKEACDLLSGKPALQQELPDGALAACEAKDATACIALGENLIRGGEFVRAAPALQVACAADHSWSCSQLATAHLLGGRGVPKDAKRARELYQKACADKEKSACEALRLLR